MRARRRCSCAIDKNHPAHWQHHHTNDSRSTQSTQHTNTHTHISLLPLGLTTCSSSPQIVSSTSSSSRRSLSAYRANECVHCSSLYANHSRSLVRCLQERQGPLPFWCRIMLNLMLKTSLLPVYLFLFFVCENAVFAFCVRSKSVFFCGWLLPADRAQTPCTNCVRHENVHTQKSLTRKDDERGLFAHFD